MLLALSILLFPLLRFSHPAIFLTNSCFPPSNSPSCSPTPVENINFSAEEAQDAFKFINSRFRQIYKETKRITLTQKVLKAVIGGVLLSWFVCYYWGDHLSRSLSHYAHTTVAEGSQLIFFTEGKNSHIHYISISASYTFTPNHLLPHHIHVRTSTPPRPHLTCRSAFEISQHHSPCLR